MVATVALVELVGYVVLLLWGMHMVQSGVIENKLPRKASREALAKYTDDLMGRIYALRENIDGN